MLRTLAAVTVVLGLCLRCAYADGGAYRASASEKGSVLVFPKIELRWDAAGNLLQDTIVTLNNNYPADVTIVMYFVSETCTAVDNDIVLTRNEPAFWAASTGLPKGVSPFTVLGAAYADPEGSTDLVLRGYIVAWATDENHNQLRWNHLSGGATFVNYAQNWAAEYNAYAFAGLPATGPNGALVGSSGSIQLNGSEFDAGYSSLLLDFFASGSQALSGGGVAIGLDTDLTLMILSQDFRQETPGPFITKANFAIWNENEVSFSGMEFCLTKWSGKLLSSLGGHFLLPNLQTDHGRAEITGLQSVVCKDSTAQSLLGISQKVLAFPTHPVKTAANLVGIGTKPASILFDTTTFPPPIRGTVDVTSDGATKVHGD